MHNRYTRNNVRLRKGEYQRNNNTFEYKWIDQKGKRHSIYAKSLPELRKKEDSISRDILDGIDYDKLDLTINDYYELWKKIKSGVRETTFATYVGFYDRYIANDFGKTKLKNVSYSSVVMFLKRLAVERGLQYSSIRNIELSLSMVIDLAVKDFVIRNNPCNGALRDLRREYGNNAKAVRALTLQEQKLFEFYLSKPGRYHRYYTVFIVMLWTGMRVGEVLGLRWDDIDFDNNEISVNHIILNYSKGKGEGCFDKINPPKTKSSIRTVPMLPKVKEALLAEKAYQDLAGIKCLTTVDGYTNFIFINSKGHVLTYKKLNSRLEQICKEINEELNADTNSTVDKFPHVHNHMLRHTFATRLREAGADMKAVSDIMGHEGILITLKTYTDASRDFKSREISLLNDYYDKAL